VAGVGELPFVQRPEHVQRGLAGHPIAHGGDAQRALGAIRLGDHHAPDRQRLVASISKLSFQAVQLLVHPALELFDGHPVDARSSSVPPNTLPRRLEIATVAELSPETVPLASRCCLLRA
jgi:hypothetical protein